MPFHGDCQVRSYQMPVSRGNVRKSRRCGRLRTGQHANRINALPNSLLCHILAYLPMKYAMATSILSQRWKHVWTSLNNLSFDDRLCSRHPAFPEVGTQGLVDFVQTVLLRTDPGNIDRFSLHWSRPTNFSYLNHWLSSAVNRHVRELELDFGENNRIQLPDMLYTSTTLEVLKLHSHCMINVPADGPYFPGVKVLHMLLHNPENALTEKMFSICPSLEDLSIHAYLYEDGPRTNFIIKSSTLKRFTFRVTLQDNYFSEIEHSVMLMAPNLQYLYIASDILGSYVLHDLHSVNEVVLDISYGEWTNGDPNCVVQLLAGLNKTKFLSVNAGITYALDKCYDKFCPLFPEMTSLDVTLTGSGWRVLHVFLNASPNLQSLLVHKQCWVEFTEEQFEWIQRELVPDCLLERVRKIEIKGAEGDEDEVRVLEYFIKFCKRLEVMVIMCKGSISINERRNLRRKISQLQTGSNGSVIQVL